MAETERFDQAAGTWDLEDRRVALAHGVTEAIKGQVALSKDLAVLDFGCGTGLVTLALAPRVGSMTGADTSTGMLATLAEKAAARAIPVALHRLNPAGAFDLGGPYHLIVSSMTLHHVPEVPALFRQFKEHLLPGGRLALADLDAEDGGFHDDPAGVYHRGFDREDIRAWLAEAGFGNIHLQTATITRKASVDYSVFLALASLPPGPTGPAAAQ